MTVDYLQGIGTEVYQLAGGIHKYIEKFPDGYFRGKLFVFDDRYSIQSNEDILSGEIFICFYNCVLNLFATCES